MKKLILLLVLGVMLAACGSPANRETLYRIGVIQLMEHPALDATYDGFVEVLNANLGADQYIIERQNAQGDVTTATTIANKFVSDKVDLIYAIATNAAQSALVATQGTDIPVIFNAVTDPVSAGLVATLEQPGANVTGVSDLSPMEKQFAIIKEFLPEAKKVGILYNIGEVNSEVQIRNLEGIAQLRGLELVVKGVANEADIATAAGQLAGEVDAFYNLTDNMMVAATPLIVNEANKAKIPVFATEDGKIDQGLLAAESLSYLDLGRDAGAIALEILVAGKKPADIPVTIREETRLYVNRKVAQTLGITIPESLQDRIEE